MPDYSLLSQREARAKLGDDLVIQLGQLTALAFAEFDGVVQPSPLKTGWYLARPGMDQELSGVAVCEGRIVSNVYVTRLRFPVGGQLLDVGMIDTVMTHPQHRQRGLARRLLKRALSGLRAVGADATMLYTPPGSLPFRIYEKMGFRQIERSVEELREVEQLTDYSPGRDEIRMCLDVRGRSRRMSWDLSLIHISEPTRPY